MDRHRFTLPRDHLLDELLDVAARTGPEYGGGLSSHLPMALQALRALGADDARMRDFLGRWLPRLEARPDVASAQLHGPWQDRRGDRAAWAPLASHFGEAIDQHGSDVVLRRVLPALVDGVGGAAFHGLIRVAHATEAGHRRELASALAYWASCWTPLPSGGGGGRLDFEPWRDTLLAAPTLPRPPGGLIVDRIRRIVHTPAYDALVGRLPGSTEVLSGLAATAIDRYRASRNFTVLHLVTGSRAMRVLLPWLDDPATAIGHFADAFAAAYLSCGIDPAATTLPPTGLGWDEVVARAIASDDEHVIKLVHACRDEARVRGGEAWLHAAGLVVA